MWPANHTQMLRLRRANRLQEVALVTEYIGATLSRISQMGRKPDILEIGCGDGTQCRHLAQFGGVTTTDRFRNPDLVLPIAGVRFFLSNAERLPLRENAFDLVYANHVLEHIQDLPRACEELRRVGRPGCIYVFTLPTSLWLLLTVPAQYLDKFCHLKARCFGRAGGRQMPQADGTKRREGRRGRWLEALRRLLPGGHGAYPGFVQCLLRFRVARWRRFFATWGFRTVDERPLLLYVPSRWPFMPTSRRLGRLGLCSSRLYVLVAENREVETPAVPSWPSGHGVS